MSQDEFKTFMDKQIIEIEKYRQSQSYSTSENDTNACVFEWIKKNAEDFRKNWVK